MAAGQSTIKLGKLAGLDMSALPSAIAGFFLVWGVLGAAALLLGLSAGEAVLGGLLGAMLHCCADTLHQLGHAWAARRTGHPMTGVRFWWVLSSSIYPPDEPPLPAVTHIRRAVGGPVASAVISLLSGIVALALALASAGGLIWWLAFFFFLDNLLVFTLGSLLPLGFTDGTTLLQARRDT